jgi:hypothetical protein
VLSFLFVLVTTATTFAPAVFLVALVTSMTTALLLSLVLAIIILVIIIVIIILAIIIVVAVSFGTLPSTRRGWNIILVTGIVDEVDEFGDASSVMAVDVEAAVNNTAQAKTDNLAPASSPQTGLAASHASQTASFVASASKTHDDHDDLSSTTKRHKVSPETKNDHGSASSRKNMDEVDEFGDASFFIAFDVDAAVDTATPDKTDNLAAAVSSPQTGFVTFHASQATSLAASASQTQDDHYDQALPGKEKNLSSSSLSLEATLQKYFGYDKFRSGQKAAIQAILNQEDVAVFWATGSGKSRYRGGGGLGRATT